MEADVRTGKAPPRRVKYNFGRLKKRGQSFFLAGADAHRVRQAALSYQKYHTDIADAGDRLRIFKESENGAEGVGVYRLAINE